MLVPIKEPVAGISAGLVTDDNDPDKFVTFMDIQGIEDFFGDMDFKVAGTKNGITTIQVILKLMVSPMKLLHKLLKLHVRKTYNIERCNAKSNKPAKSTVITLCS